MKNYTTKPIELPLSTEKEYVLPIENVANLLMINPSSILIANMKGICDSLTPFTFDRVSEDGKTGYANGMTLTAGFGCFHEIIRQPESEVEWNGEGLPPVGVECEFKEEEPKSKCFSNWSKCEILAYNTPKINDIEFQVIIRDDNGDAAIIYSNDKPVFRKPETEAERKERERLEAAYDLYRKCSGDKVMYVFDDFVGLGLSEMWLTIVDKTNYRKEQN